MLGEGAFRGTWEGADLVAVAGAHLFSPALGVCTIGNVYTRRDCRRRGLAACATSAVVRHALDASIPTIVLNVSQANDAARRVYERLGFRVHCAFVEGEATMAQHGAQGSDRAASVELTNLVGSQRSACDLAVCLRSIMAT